MCESPSKGRNTIQQSMWNFKVMSMLQQLVEDAKTMEAEAVRAENSQEPQGGGQLWREEVRESAEGW